MDDERWTRSCGRCGWVDAGMCFAGKAAALAETHAVFVDSSVVEYEVELSRCPQCDSRLGVAPIAAGQSDIS